MHGRGMNIQGIGATESTNLKARKEFSPKFLRINKIDKQFSTHHKIKMII
jgi:hypothetical protein